MLRNSFNPMARLLGVCCSMLLQLRVTAQDLEVYGSNGVIGSVSGMTQQIAQTSNLVCDACYCFGHKSFTVPHVHAANAHFLVVGATRGG